MNISFRKKTLAVIVICLMMLMSLPVVMCSNEYFVETLDGNILYVGGNGPGNYTTIQDAIDAASNGDTIFVYPGTYYGLIRINKTLTLTGEEKTLTIIDGGGTGDVIKITADGVRVSGFTIKNSGNNYRDGGVEICSNNNIISNNVIKSNNNGICIYDYRYIVIKNNIIENSNESGIDISMVISSVIENNEISNTTEGTGLRIVHSHNIIIRKNNISNNKIGLAVLDCSIVAYPFPCQDRIRNNNFFNNSIHAGVFDRGRAYGQSFLCVRFFHNYWGKTRMLPKIILTLESPDNPIRFPCNIDLFPALTPINN